MASPKVALLWFGNRFTWWVGQCL